MLPLTQGPEGEQAPHGAGNTNWKFIIIIVVLAIMVGGLVWIFSGTTEKDPDDPIDEQKLVVAYLKENLKEIVEVKPYPGGPDLFFIWEEEIYFGKDNSFLVYFEDGHYAWYLLGNYKVENGEIEIEAIKEGSLEQQWHELVEELEQEYELAPYLRINNTPIGPVSLETM